MDIELKVIRLRGFSAFNYNTYENNIRVRVRVHIIQIARSEKFADAE